MKKKPVFVAVSNQKGGVGKSTMLVALASLLNYTMDKSVAIVDCDATQRSLYNLRERDKEMVEKNKRYMTLLEEQRLRGCKIYPIKRVRPEEARATAGEFAETGEYDIIFIDLPGSMDVPGVLQTIFNVDYVLTPIAADNFVMDSSFSFASSVVRFLAEKKGVDGEDRIKSTEIKYPRTLSIREGVIDVVPYLFPLLAVASSCGTAQRKRIAGIGQ